MSPMVASVVATTLAFVVVVVCVAWHVVPWMRVRPVGIAIGACLWVHVFRLAALQIYSARNAGFHIPLSLASEIAWGDVFGACLALLGLWLLRLRARAAVPVLWLWIVESGLDFLNAATGGFREHAADTAHALTWVILNFYVPALWVSLTLAIWQLVTRRAELRDHAATTSTGAQVS